MNKRLHEQLKHPQARQRHQAIVKLARLKDEDVLPVLNDISKNDPDPSLRQLAERAIIHILNEFSSTMSRAKVQETPPSKIPPFSNPDAEKHIHKAYELYEAGSNANALQYLIKALDLTPLLVDDFDVQLLAENLTGIDGAVSAKMLTDREKRKHFFDNDTPPTSGTLPISPSLLIIFVLFVVVVSQFFLADGVEIINQALGELSIQRLKQSVQQVNGVNYYVVAPEPTVTTEEYPILIAIPDGQENTSAMLRHFSDITNDYEVVLLIPEFIDYRFSQVKPQTATLQMMIDDVASNYTLDDAGIMLFGFGDGATIATHYANIYPEQTAHVITSGGTFLYPPSDDVSYTIIYGAEDELLRGLTDNYAPFADLPEWKIPLNYLKIENIGHEINVQQIDITKQILLDVYQ